MNLRARDIMSHPVISIVEDRTVRDLIALLHEKRFSGVPVVAEDGRLSGVITLTDLLAIDPDEATAQGAESSDFHSSPAMDGLSGAAEMFSPAEEVLEHPVRDIMSRSVITSPDDATIGAVADVMVSNRIHRVLIVRNGELAGIISVMDILIALRDKEATRD